MKSKLKQKMFDELRAGLLAAVAEMDLKGTDSKVTQAMCVIEEVFDKATQGKLPSSKQIFISGVARAKLVG